MISFIFKNIQNMQFFRYFINTEAYANTLCKLLNFLINISKLLSTSYLKKIRWIVQAIASKITRPVNSVNIKWWVLWILKKLFNSLRHAFANYARNFIVRIIKRIPARKTMLNARWSPCSHVWSDSSHLL